MADGPSLAVAGVGGWAAVGSKSGVLHYDERDDGTRFYAIDAAYAADGSGVIVAGVASYWTVTSVLTDDLGLSQQESGGVSDVRTTANGDAVIVVGPSAAEDGTPQEPKVMEIPGEPHGLDVEFTDGELRIIVAALGENSFWVVREDPDGERLGLDESEGPDGRAPGHVVGGGEGAFLSCNGLGAIWSVNLDS